MIKFGTDGWRALIAEDFTYHNLRYAALGTAEYLLKLDNEPKKVVIGYDTRFLSENFAEETARVLASKGINVILADDVSSTPQTSFAALKENCDLGVVITASHNPAEYSGYKIKGSFGGPSAPEVVQAIEDEVNANLSAGTEIKLDSTKNYVESGKITYKDLKTPYIDYLREKIDIEAINQSNVKICYDPMHGAGIDTLHHLLPNAIIIHGERHQGFGEVDHPEPIGICLPQLLEKMKNEDFTFGFATDGDADRLGMADENGEFVDSHRLFMILLKYLFEVKGERGKVAKTVSLTTMVNKYCEENNIVLIQTPVGFKYIAKLMVEDEILIGGEESGGLSTLVHIPERDGIFNALLVLEIIVKTGKSLKELCDELDQQFGPHRYERRDVKVTEEIKKRVLEAASKNPEKLGSHKVIETDTTDGFKFFVENGWLLIRASGTEPLLRFYAEAENMEKVDELLKAGLALG